MEKVREQQEIDEDLPSNSKSTIPIKAVNDNNDEDILGGKWSKRKV